MRVIYFIHNPNDLPAQPLDPGTALLARKIQNNGSSTDYLWSKEDQKWIETEYLIYYTANGSPDLDNVSAADLPESVTRIQ